MSGSFEELDVPPTLVSFAVSWGKAGNVISPEFKQAGSRVVWLAPKNAKEGSLLPEAKSLLALFRQVEELIASGKVLSASTPGYGGMAEQLFKSCLGNRLGFRLDEGFAPGRLFCYAYGGFILELAEGAEMPENAWPLGTVTAEYTFAAQGEAVDLVPLEEVYEGRLEQVFPYHTTVQSQKAPMETLV